MNSATTEKIIIGGLRFSAEQVQVTLPSSSDDCRAFAGVLDELAQEKINLPFCCLHTVKTGIGTICMSRADLERFTTIAGALTPPGILMEVLPSAGSVTLFPHQSRLKMLGALLEIFAVNKLPLHSVCSSLSALVVNTDYRLLDRAARDLQTVFQLPENHAPFRLKTRCEKTAHETVDDCYSSVMDTAAVYWEPLIKIYGSSIKKELLLTTAHVPESGLVQLGQQLQAAGGGRGTFEMALMQRLDRNSYKFGLLYENSRAETYRTLFSMGNSTLIEHRNAELLYFHGPHFHDRYGVVSAALNVLRNTAHELLAVGCCGTSIYLITPEKNAQQSAEALEKIFIVPKLS
ncbi:MAG: hypothetical protein V2I35_02220 [Desulfocapsaceae bacterium]|jgi:hypothetical protein|nr:hypothetical protein [Desulfocapsaceae bacterium]